MKWELAAEKIENKTYALISDIYRPLRILEDFGRWIAMSEEERQSERYYVLSLVSS